MSNSPLFQNFFDEDLFLNHVVSDAATFNFKCAVNRQNCRYWSEENTRKLQMVHTQNSSNLIWIIPSSQQCVPFKSWIIFQTDGVPPHYDLKARRFLDTRFNGECRRRPIEGPQDLPTWSLFVGNFKKTSLCRQVRTFGGSHQTY